MTTPYERLGGSEPLRAIVDDFVSRVVQDLLIGFHFRATDVEGLKRHEYAFAAHHLGGPEAYGGRPIAEVHLPLKILGGQFDRRRELLEQTLRDHDAPPEVVAHWLEVTDRLRPQVTGDAAGRCGD
ncbi:MAG: group 1 truncated hemoglobin [Planctomycetes bacterium]|nr:group 1 truncated hemoglobin [Planctomycetota bacterium]